ncbi:alpha,alpha-trehalose-phosphate synthase (UDP-forming) [Pseudokineococcus basanitobsidens]|uniref:alpha,alpha-trehalose-phosphate synthase (UDP-forming) n=1 Tax=Pseudokineococcus basanitobsidens TaxID=1926649 RepID=UPI003BB543E1
MPTPQEHAPVPADGEGYDVVVVANRLPVDRDGTGADGSPRWKRSPGGLVTALEPVMQSQEGAWVGWSGAPSSAEDDVTDAFDWGGMHLVPVGLSADEVAGFYEGFSNGTLWPLYHDVIVAPEYHRTWWEHYVAVNERFAAAAAAVASDGAVVWVQDYQLQLVPAMLRAARPDLRIGFFNHIPFPPYEIFAQMPWRRQVLEGLLGADLLGFQRPSDAQNFLRACRRSLGLVPRQQAVEVGGADGTRRRVRAAAFPISIDTAAMDALARTEAVRQRAREIRTDLGDPDTVILGVDRLDYTKGIGHRLKAFAELLDDGLLAADDTVLVQVATPSRERVEQYRLLREDIELQVGRVNGAHGRLGHSVVQYLHHSYGREEMAAMFQAADVMLVTSLRDGMNLVAKEYVASRHDEQGALVLSEFTGAADELGQAVHVNPHDIDGLKAAVVQAVVMSPREQRRRMRSMRRRVGEHDVQRWAHDFLAALRPDLADEVPAGGDDGAVAGGPAATGGDPQDAPVPTREPV